MLIITIVGIRITARTQVGMAAVEYTILIGISIWGLVAVLQHHPGTFPITRQWFSLSGIGGKGSLASGLLIAVFIYSGWEGTLYVNEEVKHRRVNPGKAAVYAVVILTVIYILTNLGLSGVVSPAKLQANSTDALVYVAGVLGGGGWAKVMALSLALSVIALHRHQHLAGRADHLRDGVSPGTAAVPGHREPPLFHPGSGQRCRRRPPDRG